MAVYRETVLTQTTAAVAGTVQRGVITSVGSASLEQLDELTITVTIGTGVTGGALDIFFQRPIVPNPDPTVDAHWSDYSHPPQWAAAATTTRIGPHPVLNAPSAAVSTDVYRDIETAALTGDAAVTGHWGDQLRILEKVGAGVTVAGVYSIHFTGRDDR